MLVLRLSNSDDLKEDIPPEERVGNVAGRTMSEEIGLPVETVTRVIWPNDDLPDRIEKWLDQYRPDFVFLKVNWYWYGYESVPLKVERLLGPRFGKPLSKLGIRAAESQKIGTSRAFRTLRRYAHRVIGGDSPFTTDHVVQVMDATIRRIIAREDVVLLVKGSGRRKGHNDPATWYYAGTLQKKVAQVEDALKQRCNELHVAWVDTSTQRRIERRESDMTRGDGIHLDPSGQRAMGVAEGEAMAQAWLAAQ